MRLHQKLFFGLLVLLPTQLGLHFWPDWASVLGRRVDYLSPTIYLTDVLLIALLASWFFDDFYHKFLISNFQFLIKRKNFKILIFKFAPILLFAALNIFVAVSKSAALYKWVKALEFIGLAWYILKTKPNPALATFYLSLGVLYSSIIAIFQFLFQHSLGGPLRWLGERTFSVDTPGIAKIDFPGIPDLGRGLSLVPLLRPYATFPHPNVLGGYLAVLLPLLVNLPIRQILRPGSGRVRPILPMGKKTQENVLKFFKWTTIVLGTVALVLSFSRSAICVGALATVIAVAKIKYPPRKIILIFTLLLLVLGSLFLVQKASERNESLVVRQQLNLAALKIWQQSPLVGVGLGNFLVKLPEALPFRQIYFLQPVHNIYFLILAETGTVGFILFLWLIWWVIAKKKPFNIYRLPFIIFLLLGLIDHYPLTLQQGQILFAVLLALAV